MTQSVNTPSVPPSSEHRPGAVVIEGHVQGLANTRALGAAGVPVYVVDKNNCIARHSRYCRKFFRSPDFLDDAFADFLVAMAEREGIRGWLLVPSNDHAVYTLARHKEVLERYYRVLTPGMDILEPIYDKLQLLALAARCGVPVPVTQHFRGAADPVDPALTFPVIVKGRHGLSFYKALGRKALLAHDEASLRKHLETIAQRYAIEETLTQELIPFNGSNRTVSFTAFCVDGVVMTHWAGVKLREHPVRFGTATFAKSIVAPQCHQQSLPLLKALRYTGVCEIEYLLDPRTQTYKLIEINPRTWLWVALAKECGVDYAMMMYNHVNGIENQFPETYKSDICWINPLSDTAYALPALVKRHVKLSQYLASLFTGKKVNALYNKHDKKPALAYLLNLFTYLKNR